MYVLLKFILYVLIILDMIFLIMISPLYESNQKFKNLKYIHSTFSKSLPFTLENKVNNSLVENFVAQVLNESIYHQNTYVIYGEKENGKSKALQKYLNQSSVHFLYLKKYKDICHKIPITIGNNPYPKFEKYLTALKYYLDMYSRFRIENEYKSKLGLYLI